MINELLDQGEPTRALMPKRGNSGLLKAGVVDPTKVARLALQDAASVARLLVTTEAMVGEKPEKKPAPGMPPGGMGGMEYRHGDSPPPNG